MPRNIITRKLIQKCLLAPSPRSMNTGTQNLAFL